MTNPSDRIAAANEALKRWKDENIKETMPTRGPTLSVERVRALLRYDPDTGHLYWSATGERAGNIQDKGYRTIEIDGGRYYAHRVVWFHTHGVWPENDLDHINRERDDNRIANLRDVTRSENNRNRRSWAKKGDTNEED